MARIWSGRISGDRILGHFARKSLLGLVLGTMFLAASLTPSLAPRPPVLLGALGGASFAMGYLVGIGVLNLWRYLGFATRRIAPRGAQVAVVLCALLAVTQIWLSIDWQNDVRVVLHMEPMSHHNAVVILIVAVAMIAALFVVGYAVRGVFRLLTRKLDRYMPRRVAIVLGVTLATLLCWSMISGVVFKAGIHMADASFSELDALIEPNVSPPVDPLRTGSAASLIAWEGLGRQGRQFISSGPTQERIAQLTEKPAVQPVRVYVGLNSAATLDRRADLALAELKRAGGFDKSVLVVIAPTGTGWVDPAAIDTLEYLQHGDVASVAVQYSYLASWLSLLVEPNYGVDSARAMFRKVYGYWKTLPRETRPRLYLYGLSLGALSSESSLNLFDMIDDPIQGALWAGPPFPSRLWQSTTRGRQPGSPVWLPRFGDSSVVRFTNQQDHLAIPGAQWGRMRIVYLQYGSDPITFFKPSTFYQRPEWMTGKRAPDVSPTFRWVPGVTFLQLGVDMITGMSTPPGFGHVFAADHYIAPWMAVTQPPGWNDAELGRFRKALKDAPGLR